MNNGKVLRAAVLAVLLAAAPSAAGQQRMELVWSQSDGLRKEIYASSCKNGAWSEPVKITNSNANKLHPVLELAPDGRRWAFWSAVDLNGISIEYATAAQDSAWSEPKQMELNQNSAITPSVLIEDSGAVWLVWAGNSGSQDEIYFSRYVNSAWEEPAAVHPANQVPDIKPEISRNSSGQIEVRWLGVRDGRYKLLASTYSSAGGWSAEQEIAEDRKKEEDTLKEEEVKSGLPDFLPQDSQYSLKVL
jgi:hypothetical protein